MRFGLDMIKAEAFEENTSILFNPLGMKDYTLFDQFIKINLELDWVCSSVNVILIILNLICMLHKLIFGKL